MRKIISICITTELFDGIEKRRGSTARSVFISNQLKKSFDTCKSSENGDNSERPKVD